MAKIDFDALRAEVEAKFPDEPKEPKKRGRPAKAEPDNLAKADDPADLDRLVFRAFDTLVGKVDDFDRMAAVWRRGLAIIEKQVNELACIVRQHPDTETHLAAIAAIVAYDELRA